MEIVLFKRGSLFREPRLRFIVVPLLAAAAIYAGFARSSKNTDPSPAAVTSPAAPTPLQSNGIRATGIVQALEWQSIRVPQLSGVNSFELILTGIIPNGSKVSKGDTLAEFDRLNLLDQSRDAAMFLEDLKHQLDERKALTRSLSANRGSQVRQAQADLERAQLQLRKGPVLSTLDRQKNEAKAGNAQLRLDSLQRSRALRALAEDASVRILELKLKRQGVVVERLRTNLERLQIKSPLDGMVAHESTWRQGSMGPPQPGDRMYPGMPVVRVFNPGRMVVQATIDEPDFAVVSKAARARIYLDAYPNEVFDATLQTASPVANAGMDSPVRNFLAVFLVQQQSPRLLPDLSASLEIERPAPVKK